MIEPTEREKWAKANRTWYGDYDELHVSRKASDYATPEEIAAALAEAKALWSDLGRQLKAADDKWYVRLRRSDLNRKIIKVLREGWVPDWLAFNDDGAVTVVTNPHGCHEHLPKVVEICRRQSRALDAARGGKMAEYAARPIDDAAWEEELRRRERIKKWLDGDRFGRPD
jgi:hypothetical protein